MVVTVIFLVWLVVCRFYGDGYLLNKQDTINQMELPGNSQSELLENKDLR